MEEIEQPSGASAFFYKVDAVVVSDNESRTASTDSGVGKQKNGKKLKGRKKRSTNQPIVVSSSASTVSGCSVKAKQFRSDFEAQLRGKKIQIYDRLGERAEERMRELLVFSEACKTAPLKAFEFWEKGGIGDRFTQDVTSCTEHCQGVSEDGDLVQGISTITLNEDYMRAYRIGKSKATAFLGNYFCVGAECLGITLLDKVKKTHELKLMEKDLDHNGFSVTFKKMINLFMNGGKYFSNYPIILNRIGSIPPDQEKKLQEKIFAVSPRLYHYMARLYINYEEEVRQLQKKSDSNVSVNKTESGISAFNTLSCFFYHVESQQEKGFLWGDQYFKASSYPASLSCEYNCTRVIVGILTGHYERAQESVKILATRSQSDKASAKMSCPESAGFSQAAFDLSLIMCRKMLERNGMDVIEVQKNRIQVLDYLNNLKIWLSGLAPDVDALKSNPRYAVLEDFCEEIQRKINDTVQRAKDALNKMEKASVNPCVSKGKEVKKRVSGAVIERILEAQSNNEGQLQRVKELSIAEKMKEHNKENLQEDIKLLQEGELGKSLGAFMRVLNCGEKHATPEHRIMANYGCLEICMRNAKEKYEKCQMNIAFLKPYYDQLKRRQMPSIEEGKRFQPEFDGFHQSFKNFSKSVEALRHKEKTIESILLLEDMNIPQGEALHDSLHHIKSESVKKLDYCMLLFLI